MNKTITLSQPVNFLAIEVAPIEQRNNIVGFANIYLLNSDEFPVFKVRGYVIRVKDFGKGPEFTVTAPGFKAGFGYKTAFAVEDESFYKEIKNEILKEFQEQNGGMKPSDYKVQIIDTDIRKFEKNS